MAKKVAKKARKKTATKKGGSTEKMYQRRSDLGKPVTVFFDSLEPEHRETALAAHKLLLKHAPDLQHAVKWGMAHYLFPGGSMKDEEGFAIYAAGKSVNLAVGRGAELAKNHPLLQGTGKSMRHVKLFSANDAASAGVDAIVRGAVALVEGRG